MRRHIAIFIAVLIIPVFAVSQANSTLCNGFKTGVFAYRNDSSNAVLVKRGSRLQEERIKKTGVVTRFRIKWLSPCSYEIKQVWSNSKKQRENNGSVTVVQITKAGRDEYEFTCECKGRGAFGVKPGIMYRVP